MTEYRNELRDATTGHTSLKLSRPRVSKLDGLHAKFVDAFRRILGDSGQELQGTAATPASPASTAASTAVANKIEDLQARAFWLREFSSYDLSNVRPPPSGAPLCSSSHLAPLGISSAPLPVLLLTFASGPLDRLHPVPLPGDWRDQALAVHGAPPQADH